MDQAVTQLLAQLIAKLEKDLPAVFLGVKLGELTGNAICWATIQNKRSRGKIPNEDDIFVRSGNRILVARDPFLKWWVTTLSDTRPTPRRKRRPYLAENIAAME